ncbi:MAG TPA: hypothetical protein VH141_13220 [Pseudonocardia sp.]|nr:hypothetical protein [Pseudonocardia sp.]
MVAVVVEIAVVVKVVVKVKVKVVVDGCARRVTWSPEQRGGELDEADLPVGQV